MGKIIIFIALFALAYYQYTNRTADLPFSTASARTIDSNCDAVVFTTATCPYCAKARTLLNEEEVIWCEYDINKSQKNDTLFKQHGGTGVPLAIIGDFKIHGWSKSKYGIAIDTI